MTLRLGLAVALGALGLSGCGSWTGLDAKSSFSCAAPEGVQCQSMTGAYANAMARNQPGQRGKGGDAAPGAPAPAKDEGTGVLTKPISSGTPIRSAPQVLRVCFFPWEDSDGDLHDMSYVYLPIDSGRWLIEHNRRRIRDAYRPIRAPAATAATAASNPSGKPKNAPTGAPSPSGDPFGRTAPQSPAEMLGGLLRPGMPGSPPSSPAQPAGEPE